MYMVYILLLAASLLLPSCGDTTDSACQPDPEAEKHAMVEPVDFKPLTYFNHACSRCHGPYGSHYGDTFGKGLSEEELVEIVDEMAAGPGMQPLEGVNLKSLTAFHRSLIQNTPYVILTKKTQNEISGEIIPGASVALQVGSEKYHGDVQDNTWAILLPEKHQTNRFNHRPRLRATQKGKTTEIFLDKHAFSHHTPLQTEASHHE